jgi:hypothetical protein
MAEVKVSWSEMGLGRGIDGSAPSSMRAGALSLLVSPREDLVEELRAGAGYKSFESKVIAESTLQRELTGSLDSGEIIRSVKLDFGIDSLSRKYEGRFEATARGEQIHNRTIRFTSASFAPIGGVDVSTEEVRLGEPKCFLEEVLQEKIQSVEKPTPETEEWRVEVCKRCITDPRIGGATHFISSLDLGAKVFRITTSSTHSENKNFGLKANVRSDGPGSESVPESDGMDQDDALLSLGVGFNENSMKRASVSGSNYQAIIHPEVQLNEMHTKIEKDQERTIGFELSPVALLLRDSLWREPMKVACKQYIAERVARQPARVGQEGPFMLKCGSFYLREENGCVRVTRDIKNASPFYIVIPGGQKTRKLDVVEDPTTKFTIVYRTNNGMDLFLCISTHSKEAIFKHIPFHQSEATFQLRHLDMCSHASLQDWSNQCLMLHRRTRFLRRRQYLALVSHDNDLDESSVRLTGFREEGYMAGNIDQRFTVRGATEVFKDTKMPQFQLYNYTTVTN